MLEVLGIIGLIILIGMAGLFTLFLVIFGCVKYRVRSEIDEKIRQLNRDLAEGKEIKKNPFLKENW